MPPPKPQPFECERARGLCYGPVEPELARVLAILISGRPCAEAETLKPERVWAWREWVIKRSEPESLYERWLRKSAALRAAAAAFAIAPVETPQPLVALDVRRGWRLDCSWLVTRRVRGERVDLALSNDPRAAAAFPAFMQVMHENGVIHGDFNVFNALWDGERWHLIDLDGLRHRLHRGRSERIAEMQWARVAGTLRDPARVRPLFERYAALRGLSGADSAWRRIEPKALQLARHYDALLERRRRKAEGREAARLDRERAAP